MNAVRRYFITTISLLLFLFPLVLLNQRYSASVLDYSPLSFPPHVIHIFGFFSSINDFTARNRIRKYIKSYHNVYSDDHEDGSVGIVFVVCVPDLVSSDQSLQSEIDAYGDIVVLDQEENMNNGKTYGWLTAAWALYGRSNPNLRFIGKCDLDAFVRVPALETELNKIWEMRAGKIFLGRSIRMPWTPFYYMQGMGYFLSRDLVKWIATSPIARKHRAGHEDLQVGYWFHKGNLKVRHINMGRNRFHEWKGQPKVWKEIAAIPTNESLVVHRVFSDEDFQKLRHIFNEPL